METKVPTGLLTKFAPLPSRKKLVESLAANPRWTGGTYFQAILRERKTLQEATLEGNVSDETPAVAATNEILNQILMGAEGHIPLDFARVFNTAKSSLSVPIGTYGTASALTSGVFVDSPKVTSNVDIAVDKEYGTLVTWTRAHLEDATWDVLAEQNQGAGYAIQAKLCALLVAELQAEATHTGAISDMADWSDIVPWLGAVDIAKFGPTDYALVSPADYWGLLTVDQFVNSLYAGSDEVMRSGVAKTMFGITFLKVDGIADGAPIAVNSKKAIALVYRRNLLVEPFEHPELNQYGFQVSVRAKVGILNADAASYGIAP